MNMKINSKVKLGTAKSRRIYLVVALALCPLLASEKAPAQNVPATILNGGNPGITLPFGGGTFTFDINITTTFSPIAITYFLQSNDGSGFFSLTGQNIVGSPFQNNLPPGAFMPPGGDLNPVNDFDLGGSSSNPVPPGSIFISTMSLSYSAALAPGVYHIFLDSRAIVADTDFADHAVTANQFTVTIVPEPATAALAVLGGVMLFGFILRARRVMA
jgi:hypothetical protein